MTAHDGAMLILRSATHRGCGYRRWTLSGDRALSDHLEVSQAGGFAWWEMGDRLKLVEVRRDTARTVLRGLLHRELVAHMVDGVQVPRPHGTVDWVEGYLAGVSMLRRALRKDVEQ